jgi:GNAT superfamily N-acetyltransferase
MAHTDPAVVVRPLAEADLAEADRIFRVAFGTFLGAPDPELFFGDADFVRTRWLADPKAAFGAERGGRLVGSNFVTNWGSVGVFGPLTVDPSCWDQGVAQRLLQPTMELFESWGTRHAGLFTFAASAKHVGLYQKFGFWPRFLTAIMTTAVTPPQAPPPSSRLSEFAADARPGIIQAVRELTDAVYPGLDVTREIDAALTQNLGDTVLLGDTAGLQGVAVCHVGAGTEAGGGNCYIKFGAVRPGPDGHRHFSSLLDACHQLAAGCGASVLAAGVNAGRDQAWGALRQLGFRVGMQGVTMHRPNESGYSQSSTYLIDDWR